MPRITLFVLSVFVYACTHLNAAPALKDLCNIRLSQTVRFADLPVRTYTDSHGSYLLIEACPDHTVSVDFSQSNLYTERYKDLLRQMRVNAFQGGNPIRMRISGTYTGSASQDTRATVVVDKILDYDSASVEKTMRRPE